MVNVKYITTHPFSNDLISKILYETMKKSL